MEFLKYIESALGLKPRQGWILALAGAALLAFNRYGIWPHRTPDTWIVAMFWIGILALGFGAAILIVDLGDYIRLKVIDKREVSRAENAAMAARDADDAEAVANLVTLNSMEVRQLVWVLRSGHQRTSQPLMYTLQQKKIVRRSEPSSPVRLVADSIWAKRDEILQRYEKLPRESKFPYSSTWA